MHKTLRNQDSTRLRGPVAAIFDHSGRSKNSLNEDLVGFAGEEAYLLLAEFLVGSSLCVHETGRRSRLRVRCRRNVLLSRNQGEIGRNNPFSSRVMQLASYCSCLTVLQKYLAAHARNGDKNFRTCYKTVSSAFEYSRERISVSG